MRLSATQQRLDLLKAEFSLSIQNLSSATKILAHCLCSRNFSSPSHKLVCPPLSLVFRILNQDTEDFPSPRPTIPKHLTLVRVMAPRLIDRNASAITSTQGILALAGLSKICRKPVLCNLLSASYLVRFDKMLKSKAKERQSIEALRQEAEATFDLHDLIERWMRGDHPIFGFPSEQWKALHPQMNYHLQRIRHGEQHELWGASRLPACKEKDRATVTFLNSGGDLEETHCWPPLLEEEFLNSLIWQWKNDTGI